MSIFAKHKAFSLIEILVSLTIFSIVIVVGINAFVSTFKTARQAAVENVLLEDARFIMKRLENEIKSNAIDYEEYFNRKVNVSNIGRQYGQYHGTYEWQFYNGGINPSNNEEDGIGTWCQALSGDYYPYPDPNCITGPLAISEDTNTGQNPSSHREPDAESEAVHTTNSVCVPVEIGYHAFTNPELPAGSNNCPAINFKDHYRQAELYLISPDDKTKTIIRPRPGRNDSTAIGLAKMIANESDATNYTTEFECAPEFPCIDQNGDTAGLKEPDPKVLRGLFNDFIPISPLRTNIKSLSFIIAPLEDPRLAFSENFTDVRMQPQVTILLTVEPTPELQNIFQRKDLELHLQTTVSTRVQ